MNLRNLSPEQSRQLAVGILVALIVAVVSAIAIPVWLGHNRYDSVLADYNAKLDVYRRVAGTRPEVTKSLEAIRAKDPRKSFLRAGGAALAAAEVQETMRALIEGSGGRIITMQVPNARDEGRYRQVIVNVQLTANILVLRRILNTIETGTPHLFVDNLSIRSQVPSTYKPAPGAEPEMFVTLDVYGYTITGT